MPRNFATKSPWIHCELVFVLGSNSLIKLHCRKLSVVQDFTNDRQWENAFFAHSSVFDQNHISVIFSMFVSASFAPSFHLFLPVHSVEFSFVRVFGFFYTSFSYIFGISYCCRVWAAIFLFCAFYDTTHHESLTRMHWNRDVERLLKKKVAVEWT